MQPCAYAEDWSFGYDRLHKPMSEQQAAEIHRRCEPFTGYAAIFGAPTQPTHCVSVSFNERNTFYVATWLDAARRKHTEYQFKMLEPGRLFLILASEFWYEPGEADHVTLAVHYHFDPGGEVRVDKVDAIQKTRESKTEHMDVAGNWEPLPPFGQYDGLLMKERDKRYER